MSIALRSTKGDLVPAMGKKSWPLSGTGFVPRGYSAPSHDIRMLGGAIADFPSLYWSQPWIHALVNKLSRGIARLPVKVHTKTVGDDGHAYDVDVPLSAPQLVFDAPFPTASTFDLIEFIIGSLCVYGNATLVKFRGGRGNTPAEIWPMPFDRISILAGDDRPIQAYIWGGFNTIGSVGQRKVFLPEDVIHFHWFNPNGDEPWGRSPLEALATTLALENAGQRYALSSFGNAARPASFIVSDKKLTVEQRESLKKEIDAAYGGPDNAFKVALLDNGLDWKPIGSTMRDTQLVENRKISREEACAVYDMPPPMVGILDNATYANIDEQHTMLYQTTFTPYTAKLAGTWRSQLFVGEPAWAQYYAKHDMTEVTRGNDDVRSQSAQRFLQSGVKSPNELRAGEGLPPKGDPNDDQNPMNACYVPLNTMPIGAEGALRPLITERVNLNENEILGPDGKPISSQPAADPKPEPKPEPVPA